MSPPLQAPDYKHITEECLREWKGQSAGAFRHPDPVPMARFLYELCWAIVRGDLPPQKSRVALQSVVFVEEARREEELGSVLADIIAHLGQDIAISGEYRSRLVKMAKSFVESSIIAPRLLQERCEEDFLWEAEQSKWKGQDLKSKEVRVNTRLLYQQTKFNLVREESEGYAKLVTLLFQVGSDLACQNASSVTISIIKSLIGHFDLDPNRVFDIVLECFELYPDSNIFYQLIPLFPKSHAAQILGFKFEYYQRLDVNSPVPSGLFRTAALLVKSGFIDLDNVYSHLLPNDDEAFEHFDSFIARRIDEANKIGKINLAATGKDLMDDEKQEITIDLYTALEMENDLVGERAPEMEKNQKLGLLLGFLSVHDWYHAQLLFERLAHLNPVEHIEICDALFRMIEKTMSSVYDIVCQMYYYFPRKNDAEQIGTSVLSLSSFDLPKEFFQMLTACGPYLHRDTQLFQKVCRVLKAYFLSSKESIRASSIVSPESRIEEALGSCLFPSLQLIPANPAVDMEIWGVHSLLPYEARYRLYGEWEKETEQNPIILAARQTAKLDTRRLLKRLAKENLKPLGRMVAKLAHANPMTVLRTIVQQVEAYRDMITPVVDAFKYLTQLEYDILQYIVIERLAQGGREKLKDDGLNLSDWLQSLASFWGHLCKKHNAVELKSLLQYLVNQLKKGVGIELVVLEELIQQMANVQYTENVTEEQVDAMAGSETLRQQASLFGATRNYKVLSKSTNRLRDSLLPKEEPKLAVPMLLLIAQHRSKIIINADATYIKMVSEQFDRCHGILLQYVEFLSSAITPTTYAQLIPPLQDLVHKYHIEPEVAFLIYRPVMRLFKNNNGGDTFWPLDDNEEGESISSDDLILHLDSSQEPIMWSDLLNTVRSILPTKAWNSLSPDLYATFWGLTLYDLHFPKDRYDTEIKKLHENLKQLEDNSDNSSIAISRRKKDKERIQDLLDKLNSESQKHEQHVASVVQRLAREKDKWLSSSPDALKINMEFLQRCIYPRCVFSMQDAVYCATFVQTLHSLGTPFFNTVNHIDCLVCKTLQPMIYCCTEFEAGRLGRFLHDTLKMAYYWKSDESVYERECGNKPGFAVYFRFPNSQRVSYSQFIRVHWKWSSRITKALNQCMESKEYMEIRNALIVLTKISTVFPVIRKSGVNLEKRVAKLKGDEGDLKVLATGVAAALAARKSSWLSEEEFGMGHLDLKPATARSVPGNQSADPSLAKDRNVRAKSTERRHEKSEGATKPDVQQKKSTVSANGSDSQIPSSSAQGKSSGAVRVADEPPKPLSDEGVKVSTKPTSESETRAPQKRAAHNAGKVLKHDVAKEDLKAGKSTSRNVNQQASVVLDDREVLSQAADVVQDTNSTSSNGNLHPVPRKVSASSQRTTMLVTHNGAANPTGESTDLTDSTVRQQKRSAPAEEQDRSSKRRKGENEPRDSDLSEHHIDKEFIFDSHAIDKFRSVEHEKSATEEQNLSRAEKIKEKFDDKYDRDPREKLDRPERRRGEDAIERSTDRLSERRERSIERMQERFTDKAPEKGREDRNKDERNRVKYAEPSVDRTHSSDERFRGQSLPPPPPLPTSFVPQSVGANQREEDTDRRGGSTRHIHRSSPRRDEKERRQSEENASSFQDDGKHRREVDLRDRKREERDILSNKVDDRDMEKGTTMKEDSDPSNPSKRRKIKRDQSSLEAGEYAPSAPQPPTHGGSSQSFDVRERERKGVISQQRTSHSDDLPRMHGKDTTSKPSRREADQMHEREWEEEKRSRTESKRKHRK
ncbi:THO complex subunit 2-like isoform X2 [Phragmites australis]|uniref:THO complex subunit 2-like isoform X2 n=1 Tax=Phragmites australis TaxID=29695 RepID=UPI002D7875FC|nr:THO complex subunit 2-like isoform X2 [Phragmites australis]